VDDAATVREHRAQFLDVYEVRVEQARARARAESAVRDTQAAPPQLASQSREELVRAAVRRRPETVLDRQLRALDQAADPP
jgi:hypothetical protein